MLCLRELFGDEHGLTPAPNTGPSDSRVLGFLAKAKAQVTKRHMEQATAEEQGTCLAVFSDRFVNNVQSDRQETPMGPPRGTNSQASQSSSLRSERILTSSGANRGREDTDNDDDIFATPPPSCKRTLEDTGDDDEDENTEPGPSQRAHPSKWPHAADKQRRF